jgi:hypothetical protein
MCLGFACRSLHEIASKYVYEASASSSHILFARSILDEVSRTRTFCSNACSGSVDPTLTIETRRRRAVPRHGLAR